MCTFPESELGWLLAFLAAIYILNNKRSLKKNKMSGINILKNASTNKPFKSFKDLEMGEYPIEAFHLIETNYGVRIRIKMNESFMFLPERYTELMTEEAIKELNSSSIVMTYSGKDPLNQNRLMLDFNAIEVNEERELEPMSDGK